VTARPLYFGAGGGVFGLLDQPQEASGLGVVICGPFGFEAMTAYRPLRDWSRALAADGHRVLRFDLPGTGDSLGGPRDADLFARWRQAVTDAVAVVRAQPGIRRVALIGLGLGGMLALDAQLHGGEIDDVVAWATPGQGRRLLRELQAFAAFENVPHQEAGSMVVGGYRIDGPTLDALRALDLTDCGAATLAGRRVLLLGRADGPPDAALQQALSAAGADLAVADGTEFAAMTADAARAATPHGAIGVTRKWLAEGLARPGGAVAAADSPAVQQSVTFTFTVSGVEVEERPLRLALPDGRTLFAVRSAPVGPPPEDCIVLLNAGALNRTGPNRMWVELARRWAGRGVSAIRVDLSGIGESDGDALALHDDQAFHTAAYVAEVEDVLDLLEREHGARRFVLVGLCSGAFLSFHAAIRHGHVAAAVMFNPRLLVASPQVVHRRAAQRAKRVFSLAAWGDLVRYWRHTPRVIASALTALARRAIEILQRADREQSAAADALLDQFSSRGVRGTFVFTGSEPLDQEFTAEGRWERLAEWPTVAAERRPDAPDTHTLRPVALQAWAHELADREIAATFSDGAS